MTQAFVGKRYWLFFLFFALNACTGVVVKDSNLAYKSAYQDRTGKLISIVEWGLQGRISLDDGDQGGSGKLQWNVKSGHSELDFHGAMGRGAWRLQTGPEGALLKMADGTEQTAASVNELVQESMGWPIPVNALQWWVRGLPAPGPIESEQLGPGGLLTNLRQFGWNVDFTRYDSVGAVELPVRLNATHDSYRVKLAISHWRMDMGDDITN